MMSFIYAIYPHQRSGCFLTSLIPKNELLLWRFCLCIELFSPVVTDDPSGNLLRPSPLQSFGDCLISLIPSRVACVAESTCVIVSPSVGSSPVKLLRVAFVAVLACAASSLSQLRQMIHPCR